MKRPMITDDAHAVLCAWKRDRPVATLMGEFSAGKSTLLNFVLGMEAAPTRVTATDMPPSWFCFSETPYSTGLTWDGEEEPVDLEAGFADFRSRYVMIRRGLNSAFLKGTDLIDAPGISDPGLQKDALRFLSRYTDFVVWCTAANQAWRQTENAAFGKLSKRIKENSLLVITRMDKLRSDKDRAKVIKRVTQDAGPHFKDVLPLQTPKAAAIDLPLRNDAPDGAWVQTGGHAFMTMLEDTCGSINPKSPKTTAAKKTKSAAHTKKPAAQPKTQVKAAAELPDSDLQAGFRKILDNLRTMSQNRPHCLQIDHLIDAIPNHNGDANTLNASLRECLRIETDDLDIQRYVSQIGREIRAFQSGDRLRLDT